MNETTTDPAESILSDMAERIDALELRALQTAATLIDAGSLSEVRAARALRISRTTLRKRIAALPLRQTALPIG